MSSERKPGSGIAALIVYVIIIVTILYFFIKAALERGRGMELLHSSAVLALTYILMNDLRHADTILSTMPGWIIFVPFAIYVVYWFFLLVILPPNVHYSTNIHWGDPDWWWSLNGWEFEEEVAKVYRKNGYQVKVTQKTSDGGIDLIMYKDKRKIIVQCKHYQDPVSVHPIRELNGLRDDFNADELIMVASSGVTKMAREFVQNKTYYRIVTLADIIRLARD